jgi:hypothetical protein
LTHWLDVLKTRWQAEAKIEKKDPTAPKLSTMERILKIYRNEGFRGFYKGYVSRVLGIGPMRATYWGVMDHTTHILEPVKQLNQWQRLVIAGIQHTYNIRCIALLCIFRIFIHLHSSSKCDIFHF